MSEENMAYCDAEDIENNKAMAILAYLFILFLVPLLIAPKSKYARFHTNQGIILCLTNLFLFMVWFILKEFIFYIPVIGYPLYLIIFLVCFGLIFAGTVYGIVNSILGNCKPLPLIGNLFVIVKYDLPSKMEDQ